jgi:hypothetical protein
MRHTAGIGTSIGRLGGAAWGATLLVLGSISLGTPACFGSDSGGPGAGDGGLDGADVGTADVAGDVGAEAGAKTGAEAGTEAGLDGSGGEADAPEAGAVASPAGTCQPDAGLTAGTPPATIDFDTWPGDAGAIPAGTLLSNQIPGVTFSSSACGGATVDSDGEASSAPNFLVGNPGSFSPIVMDLAAPLAMVGATLVSVGSATVTATAYDAGGGVVATTSVTNPGTGTGFGVHNPIVLTGAGIVRVVFAITASYPGDGFGVDDITL